MEFLGMIIGQGEIKMDEKKLEAIEKWKPPTSVKGIRLFTGFTNFYRKFILDFSNIVAPSTYSLTKGNPGCGPNSNNERLNASNIYSHAPPSYKSLT